MTPRCTCFCCQGLSLRLETDDHETVRQWAAGGIKGLGKPAVEELMIEWFNPLLEEGEENSLWVGTWE